MNGNDSNSNPPGAVDSEWPFDIQLDTAGNALRLKPDLLGAGRGDRLTWRFKEDTPFELEFQNGSPFYTPTAGDDPERWVMKSNSDGVLTEKLHPKARGNYFYEVRLQEGGVATPAPVTGCLMVNVQITASIIVRGPVDPM